MLNELGIYINAPNVTEWRKVYGIISYKLIKAFSQSMVYARTVNVECHDIIINCEDQLCCHYSTGMQTYVTELTY